MKDEGRRQKAEKKRRQPVGAYRRTGNGVFLCAEISFDCKLLDASDRPDGEPGPKWWLRLLTRKRSLPAKADTVRALLDAGCVDELCLRVRPRVDGRSGGASLSGTGGKETFFARSITWDLMRMAVTAEGDCLLQYRRADG